MLLSFVYLAFSALLQLLMGSRRSWNRLARTGDVRVDTVRVTPLKERHAR